MRDDMDKVIVERPRAGGDYRKRRPRSWDDLPFYEGMRRGAAYHGELKRLNENLTPLRRYLERQVGRPWNKVYAEIAAGLRADNAVQQHVRDHLHDFVAIKPRRLHHGMSIDGRTLWYQPLYVDPQTGLLCRTDRLPEEKARRRAARQKAKPMPDRIALAEDRELRRIRGTWYEVRLAPLPEPVYRAFPEVNKLRLKPWGWESPVVEVHIIVRRLTTPAVWDVVRNKLVEAGPLIDDPDAWKKYRRHQADRRYAVAKRSLSRRELRWHSLDNAPCENR
jgi:hypothetical protein